MKTVIEMAREADFCVNEDGGISTSNSYGIIQGELERFAELVRADAIADAVEREREACAKVCEERLGPTATDFYGKTYAAAIRARSNT